MIWHKETQQTMLDLGNHAPQKHEKMEGFLTENGMKMLAEGCSFFGKKCQSTIAFAAQKWEMSAVVMGEKMMTGIAKKSAVTICKLDYLVCISLIYSVL